MSLEVTPFTLGDLNTNCYLVADDASGQAFVIDPADQGGFISEQILERQLSLQGIVLTHGHFDHALGLLELSLNFPVPIYLHPADQFLLARAADSAKHWLGQAVDPVPPATAKLAPRQVLKIGQEELMVLHIPGHTPGSIALLHYDCLFTGDTLLKDEVGSTNHSYSNRAKLWRSIKQLRGYKGKFALPGHGESFYL